MKPILVTAVHGRRNVTQMFVDHYRDWEITKVCVCSTDSDVRFMRENGWHVIQEGNRPLGNKWNAVFNYAMEFEWSHLIQVGSDDLMNKKYLNFIEGVSFGGVKTMYFWNIENNECMMFTYCNGRKDYVLGAGRVFSRYLVKTVLKDTEGKFFPSHYNKGLDRGSEIHCGLSGFRPEVIDLPFPMIVDVKSGENIWSFDRLKKGAGKGGTDFKIVKLEEVKRNTKAL